MTQLRLLPRGELGNTQRARNLQTVQRVAEQMFDGPLIMRKLFCYPRRTEGAIVAEIADPCSLQADWRGDTCSPV